MAEMVIKVDGPPEHLKELVRLINEMPVYKLGWANFIWESSKFNRS